MRNKEIGNYNSPERIKAELSTQKCSCFERIHRGQDEAELKKVVKEVHVHGGLVLSAIGISQESSDKDVIKDIAIRNKICGVDIQHIGDAGYGGVAPVENIFAMSNAIRGMRHTVSVIARSIHR